MSYESRLDDLEANYEAEYEAKNEALDKLAAECKARKKAEAALDKHRTVMVEAEKALLLADSDLSAYGHGRPLDKGIALGVSQDCRKVYAKIKRMIMQ